MHKKNTSYKDKTLRVSLIASAICRWFITTQWLVVNQGPNDQMQSEGMFKFLKAIKLDKNKKQNSKIKDKVSSREAEATNEE